MSVAPLGVVLGKFLIGISLMQSDHGVSKSKLADEAKEVQPETLRLLDAMNEYQDV